MLRRNRELWYALAAIIAVTAFYLFVYLRVGLLPPAANLMGHGIGILGFVLMLMTQTLYSLRKHAKSAAWGTVAAWFKFHIFTGLVGPYMALLHPAMKFSGLAAVLSALTVIVVASGVVGRYMYSLLPRTVENVETVVLQAGTTGASAEEIGRQMTRLATQRKVFATWRIVHVPLTFVLFIVAFVHIVGAVYYATLLR